MKEGKAFILPCPLTRTSYVANGLFFNRIIGRTIGVLAARSYLMNSNSLYFGNGQRPSSTRSSSLSI